MTRRVLAIASTIVVLALAATAVIVGATLGEGAQLPVHWGLDGTPDRYADRWQALLIPVAFAASMSLLFYFLPAIEPRREGLERSWGLYMWTWAGLLLVSLAIQFVTVATAYDWDVAPHRVIAGAVGALLVLIGNQLGKSRSMYMVGIRTPWTLASEEVWVKTHRLGGKLMVLAGLIVISGALIALPPEIMAIVTGVAVGIAALFPAAYSFWLWRKEGRNGQPRR
ncbi:MAG TPA: SdpI family protein [Allosphingosinicella sp.]